MLENVTVNVLIAPKTSEFTNRPYGVLGSVVFDVPKQSTNEQILAIASRTINPERIGSAAKLAQIAAGNCLIVYR